MSDLNLLKMIDRLDTLLQRVTTLNELLEGGVGGGMSFQPVWQTWDALTKDSAWHDFTQIDAYIVHSSPTVGLFRLGINSTSVNHYVGIRSNASSYWLFTTRASPVSTYIYDIAFGYLATGYQMQYVITSGTNEAYHSFLGYFYNE